MNAQSVPYTYINNQEKSSWTDDPFELKGTFKGLTVVTNARNLSDYAEELAYQYGKYDGDAYQLLFLNIPEDEQGELVRLYMESTDRETGECVHGTDFSIDNDYTCALLALMREDTQETRDTFADITRKNIIAYYKNPLQHVLDEACHDLLCNLQAEHGFHSYAEKDSGEIFWSKY